MRVSEISRSGFVAAGIRARSGELDALWCHEPGLNPSPERGGWPLKAAGWGWPATSPHPARASARHPPPQAGGGIGVRCSADCTSPERALMQRQPVQHFQAPPDEIYPDRRSKRDLDQLYDPLPPCHRKNPKPIVRHSCFPAGSIKMAHLPLPALPHLRARPPQGIGDAERLLPAPRPEWRSARKALPSVRAR
jgi:hypothetical protein